MTEVIELKKVPSCAEMLRAMEVGEEQGFKMILNTYGMVCTSISRLRKKGLDYSFVIDADKNVMTVKRVK